MRAIIYSPYLLRRSPGFIYCCAAVGRNMFVIVITGSPHVSPEKSCRRAGLRRRSLDLAWLLVGLLALPWTSPPV